MVDDSMRVPMRVIVPVADIKARPEENAPLTSQLLLGDEVQILERDRDFCSIQSTKDGYVGYIATASLDIVKTQLTHYVCVPRTFLYLQPDLKLPSLAALSLASKLTITDFVENRGTLYGQLENGNAVFAGHLASLDGLATDLATDYVTIAQSLISTPYLWGGVSAFGIDCSGLVQLALSLAGQAVLRDSDMQAATIGQVLSPDTPLQRGDLVFWHGHVAIMCDEAMLVHANGASMDVRIEPYTEAVARIANQYGSPILHRRPFA